MKKNPTFVCLSILFIFIFLASNTASSNPAILGTVEINGVKRNINGIMGSISIGHKPEFSGIRGETPVRSRLAFLRSKGRAFFIMIDGVVCSKNHEQQYADILFTWKGEKVDIFYPKLDETKFPSPHNSVLLNFKIKDDTSESYSLSSRLSANSYENNIVSINKGWYSHKQKRLLIKLYPKKDIEEIAIDVSGLSKSYYGFFTVRLFNDVTDISGPPLTNRFEEYPNFYHYSHAKKESPIQNIQIGAPIHISPISEKLNSIQNMNENERVFKGQFLVPVGLNLKQDIQRTNRVLEIKANSRITAIICGVFSFSSYSHMREEFCGGSGGLQDYYFRFDYFKSNKDKFGPYSPSNIFTAWTLDNQKVAVIISKRDITPKPIDLQKDTNMNSFHQYSIKFDAPTGKDQVPIFFHVNDGKTQKTWDNSGALLICDVMENTK